MSEPVEEISAVEAEDPEAATTWKECVFAILTSNAFSPAQFERLTQLLFREASFESVKVTGRSGETRASTA